MAESVQYYMELMIPELKELESKELFSKDEINQIIKTREDFEYKLKSKNQLKTDYLSYIRYEMALDSLRAKRKIRMKVKGTGVTDFAGMRRIHFIFNRACTKFYADKSLWLDYIKFARKAKSLKGIMKIFGSALRWHPREPEFWRLAAEFEWQENASVDASRSLYYRGLRLNEDSKSLWVSYFKMELLFLAKILTRRSLLGIKSTDISKKQDEIDCVIEDENHIIDQCEKSNCSEENFLNGAVPVAVYKNGYNKVEDKVGFKQDILNAMESLDTIKCLRSVLEHLRNQLN